MIRSLTLALALALGLSPALALAASTTPLAAHIRVSPVTDRKSDYRLGNELGWVGAPTATLDCIATDSNGDMGCSGANPTKYGAPTTVGTPFYPWGYAAAVAAGDASVGQSKALKFDGAADTFDVGDVCDADGPITAASVYLTSDNTDEVIMGKDDNNVIRGWVLKLTSGQIGFSTGGVSKWWLLASVPQTPPTGTWNIVIASYDGTTVRMNINGTAISGNSGTTGYNADAPYALRIGSRLYAGAEGYLNGRVSRATCWRGWAASAAEQAKMFQGMAGLLSVKGAALGFTRADTGFVCPVLDSECYWVGAGIPEIDRRGIWVGGAAQASNKIAWTSDARSWSQRAGTPVTVTYNATGGPEGGPYSALSGVGAMSTADIWGAASGFTSDAYFSTGFYLRKVSASGTLRAVNASNSGRGSWGINFALLGSGWEWITSTHAAVTVTSAFQAQTTNGGLQFYASSGTLDFDFALATQQDSAVLGKPRYTSGSAYSGVATTHQGIPPRTDTTTWVNTILQSENIGTTWTNSTSADSVDVAVASDGSFTADKLYENNTDVAWHFLTQPYTATAAAWTFSGEFKTAERNWVCLSLDNGTSVRCFDATACSVGGGAGGTPPTGTVQALTNGWCRIAATKTMTAGATAVRIYLADADLSYSHAGVVGSGFYVTRLQATPTATDQPYCPTTTAASTCGDTGGLGKAVTNLALQSETLNVSPWGAVGVGFGLSAITGGQADPDGGTGAWLLVENDQASTHSLYQGWMATAAPYTLSIKAKAKERTKVMISINASTSYTKFDLADCSATTSGGSATGASIALSGGWCLLRTTATPSAGATSFRVYLLDGIGTQSYTGDGTSGLYVYQPQLELASVAGRYCGPTTASSKTCVFVERAPKPLAISITALPGYANGAWSSGSVVNGLFSLGTYTNPSNINTSLFGTYLYTSVFDLSASSYYNRRGDTSGTSGSKTLLIAPGVDGASSTIDFGGTQLSMSDNARTGSGIWMASPTSLNLGQRSTTEAWNGWISSWASCTHANGCSP